MIEQTLRRRGLPDELKYVAVIESALDPAATSPVGAAGLWQFMPETGAQYGLDAWSVRDPVRSTDAAARYLSRPRAATSTATGSSPSRRTTAAPAASGASPPPTAAARATRPTFWDIRDDLPRRDARLRRPLHRRRARYFEPPPPTP